MSRIASDKTAAVHCQEGETRRVPIALIGIGLMGTALTERLLAAGFALRGYDIAPERLRAFEAMGGTPAASAADAARGAEVVITSLMTAAIVRQAVLGEQGAAEAMPPGSLLIDTTTCGPGESIALANDLSPRGISLLDATISGSSASVRRGTAVVLAGGDPEAFERARPIFDAYARTALHVGPNGAGATAKLVVNLVVGLNRLALAEALTLGERAGIEPARMLDVLREAASYSRIMDGKGKLMVTGRFEPEARLSQHLKDVGLILDLGRELSVPLPASALHQQLLTAGVARGWGDLDNAAIILVLRALAGGEA
ncbi:MAG: NAD(P)-dependent oxidoreductase [Armatimonadetes bacterium]|nr:NAD(P)-dependent oxidoreductase [Armatimonadota bacterium]